ncbi:hypothetical protein Tco_0236572 [Tanacetum coccineum]
MVEGKGKAIATKEQAAQSLLALHTPKRRSTTNQFIFQRRTLATEEASTGPSAQPQDDTSANIVRDSPSPVDAETGADTDKTNSGEEKTVEIDEGPDPGESRVALAGPNLEPTHEEFMANVYPNVHESLKFLADEHVILEDLLSSTGTLSSMKNLDDAYTIGDQFLNDKSSEDELGKLNVEAEVVSMVTVPIHQASSSVPPLSTPIIDLSPPNPKFSGLEQKSKTLDNTTQNLGSRVFTLELRDLPHKINQTVNEVVHVAIQAPFRDRFRELPEANIKEILHQCMDEFLADKDKSRKRRHDNQDSPPPPPDSDSSKKRRHDSDASGSTQPPAPQSSAWKTSDTRETPSNSSRKKSASHSEQLIEDVPIPYDVNVLDSEDTDTAHLPKIKTKPDWLKPVPKEDRPTIPELDWVILPNELPVPKNNWANALASSYQDLDEYKLLRQNGNMSSFINWFCKWIGKKKLSKADLEGPAFKVVRPFHDNNISFQFQMEECHLLLTDQVNLANPEGHQIVPDVSKPLPLGGPAGHVTIQSQFFFNQDLDYLVSGSKERRNAMSISKLKAANYPDFGLEELVPSLWIESKRDYDISAAYGISQWYAYLKEIVHSRADYKEYKISEADFKNMHPNDFEDLYLLHLQGQLNHLSGADKVQLFNAVNLWIRNIVIRKHVEDLQLGIEISKPRAVIYRDRNDQKKMMRETEVHKFSDGTLNRILDKLDHMVKDFKLFKYNPGMTT